jgi:hypothetical protein
MEDTMATGEEDSGKVSRAPNSNTKYKLRKGNGRDEADTDLDLPAGRNYDVKKLKVDRLPGYIEEPDGKRTTIRWLNNFSVRDKDSGDYLEQRYTVTIPNLATKLKEKNSKLVIYSELQTPNLYYYNGTITGDSFDLEDGDPGVGMGP